MKKMKKFLSVGILSFAVLSFVLTGCGNGKKDSSQSAETQGAEVLENSEKAESVDEPEFWGNAVSIYSQAGVYVKDSEKDGKLRWVGALVKGQEVLCVKTVSDDGSEKAKIFPLNFVNDKDGAKPADMAKIQIDGSKEEFYVVASNLVINAFPYVVTGDLEKGDFETFIFSDEDFSKITSKKIPLGTIAAVNESSEQESDFLEATFYIPDGEFKGLYRNKYVQKSCLTNAEPYLFAAMAADRIKNTKDISEAACIEVALEVHKELISIDDNPHLDEYTSHFIKEIGLFEFLESNK